MEPALDVICVGEALVDFLPEGTGLQVWQVEKWVRCPGGSPANVAIGLARLGAKSAMIGVVGTDEFGTFLLHRLAEEGVNVGHLRRTEEGKTGLVFISLNAQGERSFAFHRVRSAEFFLDLRDVDVAFLSTSRAMHFGSNSLLEPLAQRAVEQMAVAMSQQGKIVSIDPNLRLNLWPKPDELKGLLARLFPLCSVAKLAEDEIAFVTGTTDVEQALVAMRKAGVVLPVVTLGPEGAAFFWQGKVVRAAAPPAKVVDTTGAGDGFMATLLFGLTRLFPDAAALKRAHVGELRELVTFACAAAARVVEKLGAVTGLPRMAELEKVTPTVLGGRRVE
jgi:fructokinase